MQSPRHRQLILEAALEGSVIRGTVIGATGPGREFHGWLELNAALEAMLADPGRDPGSTGDSARCTDP
jgi:hypothetical protein